MCNAFLYEWAGVLSDPVKTVLVWLAAGALKTFLESSFQNLIIEGTLLMGQYLVQR